MTHSQWQDHFKSAVKKAEGLYSKDTTQISLLLFCLRAKMIPPKEYLEWAKESYQLPLLAEKFFQNHPPQKEFFKKWLKSYNWSMECLPVAEWDGSLIVACLEPPPQSPPGAAMIFVLTSPDVLEATWLAYQKPDASKNADITDMTALAATVIGKPEDEKLTDEEGQESNPEPEPEESLENPELSSENEAGGSPEGLFAEAPVPVVAFAGIEKKPVQLPPSTPVSSAKSPSAPTPKIEILSEEKVRKGPRSSEPIMKIEIASSGVVEDKTKIDTAMDQEDPAAGEDEIPSAPVKPATLHSGSAAYFLEKVRKQNQDKFDKEAQASLRKMKTFFKKSLLLAIGDKDRLIKPMVWDADMEAPSSTLPEFNLKTPSIFKIVSGTQKPYHGYVVVNDLNESFFEACNHGQIPDHVTIVPLMDGEMVVGMIMGLGEKSNYNKNVLEFTEATAKEFSQKVLKTALSKVA